VSNSMAGSGVVQRLVSSPVLELRPLCGRRYPAQIKVVASRFTFIDYNAIDMAQ